jgi:hypothetical protein
VSIDTTILLAYSDSINVPHDRSTISFALETISPNGIITVSPGTYYENLVWPDKQGIKLIGDDREYCIINGSAISSVIAIESQVDTSTLISGFTIENGYGEGGGFRINNGSPTIENIIIRNNYSSRDGGGMRIENGGVSLKQSQVENNSSYYQGAGLSTQSSTINIVNSEFRMNSTTSSGGGIAISSGSMVANNVLISNNSAGSGGGLQLMGGSTIINSSIICNNTAMSYGGGIRILNGSQEIANTVISSNTALSEAVYAGSALHIWGSPVFTNTTISNNKNVSSDAYSIICSGGLSEFTDCNIIENTNGIYKESHQVEISNSNIISNNHAFLNNSEDYPTASNNYWGSSSGPNTPFQNPYGTGDSTNQYINVTPWLTAPNTAAPPIPAQNTTVTSTGDDFISLSWDSSPLGDFSGFKVYIDTDSSGYPYANSIDVGTDTSYTLSSLNLGTEYFLAVTVYDTDGNESWYSNEVTGVTRVMEVQYLDIAGDEDLFHLITHAPLITFDYFDSMGETQTNYNVQISTDSTFQSNLIWDSGEVASNATSIQYTGGALLDGAKYYLRAKVASGLFWSNWTTLAFGMNTEPSSPVQLSLIGDEVATSDVQLEISNSSDAEEDYLSYEFRLYDATQTIQLDSAIAVVQDPDGTAWEVLTALDDNAQHWWTVQAFDGYEYSELAGPESFLINFENDDPAGFDLTSPLLDEAIITQSPLFTWDPAIDPDPLDTVRYVLYLETPDPGIETFFPGIDTSFQLAYDLEDNTTYHWKVVARDLNDSQTESNGGYQSFTVNTSNDLPLAFELLYPVYNEMVTNLQPEFLWDASSDPDDETIVLRSKGKGREADQSSTGNNSVMVITGYDFYLGTDSMLTAVIPVEVVGTSYSPETDLTENQVYYWAVSALDDSGGVTFSDTASFWTNAENEAPAEFALLLPTEAEVLTVLSPTFTWESSSDPDLYDGFGYHILLGSGPEDMDTLWSGEDTSLTLDWELEDNTTYYWSVFTEDWSGLVSHNTGGYQSFTVNTSNDLPEYFELLYPVWDEMVSNLSPEFLWEASSDPDDETIALRENGRGKFTEQTSSGNNSINVITGYEFYLGTDVDLSDVVPVEVIGTSYAPAEELLENQVYYWAVSALDDSGGVTFSDTASFWTNSENTTPSEFTLLTPLDDTESTLTPTFTWTLSSDADLQDTLNFTLRYGTDVFNLMDIPNGSSTQFTVVEPLEDNTEYIWQVVAEDISGAIFATEFSSFFVNSENDDPGYFSLIAPDSASWITNADLMLVWEPSMDLEGADIEYIIHIGASSESLNPVDTISVNYYALSELEDGYYYWQVEALDNLDGSQLSEMWSFLINVHNDPPDPFALTYPEADLVLTEQQPTFTWEASSSGDAGDHTSYRVELGNSAESMGIVYEGDSTLYTPELALEDNSVYFWRVIAIDLAFATTVNEGGYQSFVVNTINDAPTMAELISPDSVVILSDMPTFSWNASTDVDPFDSLSYELHWWTDFTEMDSILTTETSVSPETPLADDNLQYFWNVITMDANGGIAHSEEKTFWVDFMPEVPAFFALLGPDSASSGNGTRPELTWAEAIDPDPFDAVHYSVAVATDSLMENVIYEQIAHVEVTIPEIDLENDTRYYWQVTAIDEDSLTTASSVWTFDVGYVAIDQYAQIPTEFVLDQNYPNPFNPSTTIRYGLPEEANVSLVIYDVRGQVVQTIASEHHSAGWYDVVWNGQTADGKTISTGIYFARLVAGEYSQVIKMLYLK